MAMSQGFDICGRWVGGDARPLVIAEIGINHNGCLKTAKAMVDAAASAGAEVIKHQTHVVEDEMSAKARETIPGNADESIYDIMAKCALDEEDEAALKAYVEQKGMIFISTPFSRAAADRLERMGVCAYKIGSGECNNYPLLEHIASFGKPVILSTGMNTIESVAKAVAIFEKTKVDLALLHTTNLYPTPAHLVRLGGMQALQKHFPNCVIGLSDHTTSNLACFAAVALGAKILERHFTDSMEREGPDIINSMDPAAMSELIQGSAEITHMLGGEKGPAPEEQVTMDFAFATVVAIKDIDQGELISEDNVWVKRPGTGEIPAEDYNTVIGRTSSRKIKADEHLGWSDLI